MYVHVHMIYTGHQLGDQSGKNCGMFFYWHRLVGNWIKIVYIDQASPETRVSPLHKLNLKTRSAHAPPTVRVKRPSQSLPLTFPPLRHCGLTAVCADGFSCR